MSDTPRTDAKASDWNEFDIYDGDAVVPASFARILERENAALRNLLHEIQENTSIGIKTCARIHAALDAERKENK